jgi:spermidine/putrescine transport system substrate-binding protein
MKDPNSLPQDPMLAELVKMSRRKTLTRRTALAGAAGVGAALGLAACAPAGDGGGATSEALVPATDVSDSEKVLVWNNWPDYMDLSEDELSYPTLVRFEEETGIKVEYLTDYSDNDDWYGQNRNEIIAGKDVGADLICPTEWLAARLVLGGQVQKFTDANIPNKANVAPAYLGASYDAKREYTLPYQGILGGIAYNKELYKELTGKEKPETVADLWSPDLQGRVVVLSEMRDTVGLIALEKGLDITSGTSLTEDAYMEVIEDIKALSADGRIKQFAGNEYTDGFKSKDYVAGIVWSGDVIQMNFSAGYEEYGFFLPENSGGTISADVFTVPMGATHKKNAEILMNYYYDPEIAALLAQYVNYITPVVGAYEAAIELDPELAENKLIFPDEEFLSLTHAFRALSPQEEQSFATAWGRVSQLGA